MGLSEIIQNLASITVVLTAMGGVYTRFFKTSIEYASTWVRCCREAEDVFNHSIAIGGLRNPWLIEGQAISPTDLVRQIIEIANTSRNRKIRKLALELSNRVEMLWAKSPHIPPSISFIDEFGTAHSSIDEETYLPILEAQIAVAREGLDVVKRLKAEIDKRRVKH